MVNSELSDGYVCQGGLTSYCQTRGVCQRHDYGTVLGQRTGSEPSNIQDSLKKIFLQGLSVLFQPYAEVYVYKDHDTHEKVGLNASRFCNKRAQHADVLRCHHLPS